MSVGSPSALSGSSSAEIAGCHERCEEEATSDLEEVHSKSPPVEAAETQENRIQRAVIVGQLAGGILHDFNNILTVISGTIGILAEAVADRPDLAAIAKLIDDAAARGTSLASHLLAFARGQPSQPRCVDVNALLEEATRLLRPALGGQIEVASIVAPDIAPALADRGQLLAAIVGLAIMARDAMPEGGKLTFETKNARGQQAEAGEVLAADHVVIAVRAARCETAGKCPDRLFADIAAVEDFIRGSGGHIRTGQHDGSSGLAEIHLPTAALHAR
jgi:signal transduction histidine kinase